jgi:SAM-dependent methyltransferase
MIVALSLWFGLDGFLAWVVSFGDSPILFHAMRDVEVRAAAFAHAPVWLGAAAVGALLGMAGIFVTSALTFAFVARHPRPPYRLPENAPAWVKAVERVASRYALAQSPRPRDRVLFHHIRGKLLADPAARLVAELGGDEPGGLGSVLDIGSGRGQLALLLLELGPATRVRGLDWDRRKVERGVRAAEAHDGSPQLDAGFSVADARSATLEPADTVLLVDVLHYFLPEEQDAILERAAAAVLPGGRIVLREAEAGRGVRSVVTWLEEHLFTFLRHNRGERVRFRAAADFVGQLESKGFACETRRAWGRMPFSNVLIVGRRAGRGERGGPD